MQDHLLMISVHLKSDLIKGVVFGGSGLITGVTSFEGENIILFTISVHLKSVLIKGVAFGESGLVTVVTSFEGGEYNIIYYLCAS